MEFEFEEDSDAFKLLKEFAKEIDVKVSDLIPMALNLLIINREEIIAMHRIKKLNPDISCEEMLKMLKIEDGDDLH